MTEERPCCGMCLFFSEVVHENEKGEKTPTGIGYCCANPPEIHMVPGPQPKVAMGNEHGMSIIPRNFRPAVSESDNICRFFYLADAITTAAKCSGCSDGEECEGDCACQ